MKDFLKISALVLLLGLITGLVVVGVLSVTKPKEVKTESVGAGYGPVRTPYDLLGTAASSTALTNSFASNSTTFKATSLENLHLDIKYKTAVSGTNQFATIYIEGSNDGGTTFFPISSKSLTTSEIDLYPMDGVVFPGSKTSATATTYLGATDFDMVADTVRISAKQNQAVNTSTEFGTIYVRGTVTSP